MMNGNELITGIDADVRLLESDKVIFDQVDQVVDQAIIRGNPGQIYELGNALRRNMQVSGLAMAKLLYLLRENWETFGIEDDFYNVVYAELGRAKSTVTKYINTWQSLFENPAIPDEVKEELKGKPMKSLFLLTGLANENAKDVDWTQITDTNTPAEITNVVRDIRGVRTSAGNSIIFKVDVVTGQISVRQGETEMMIGILLNEDARKNNPLGQAAFDRIISRLNAMEI